MTVYDFGEALCSAATVAIVLIPRERLRMNAPKVRLAIGGAGVLLATMALFFARLLLPRPSGDGLSPSAELAAFAAGSVFLGILFLSLIEIGGATIQFIKRYRYYRRNGS
jgi:hypothetical protein